MEQQKKSKKKGCLKFFIWFFGVALLFSLFSKLTGKEEDKKTAGAEITDVKIDSVEVVRGIIELAEKNKNEEIKNVERMKEYLFLFEDAGSVYRKYEDSKNKELLQELEKMKKEIGKLQASKLPQMRKVFANDLKDKFFRTNIDVKQNGTTLELTGGKLANNANKEDTYSMLKDLLYDLRFKKLNLKWYKYDDEYYYYEINSKKDSELYNYLHFTTK